MSLYKAGKSCQCFVCMWRRDTPTKNVVLVGCRGRAPYHTLWPEWIWLLMADDIRIFQWMVVSHSNFSELNPMWCKWHNQHRFIRCSEHKFSRPICEKWYITASTLRHSGKTYQYLHVNSTLYIRSGYQIKYRELLYVSRTGYSPFN